MCGSGDGLGVVWRDADPVTGEVVMICVACLLFARLETAIL